MQKIKLISDDALWQESFLAYARVSNCRFYFSTKPTFEYDAILFNVSDKSKVKDHLLEVGETPVFVIGELLIDGFVSSGEFSKNTPMRDVIKSLSIFFVKEEVGQTLEINEREQLIASFLQLGMGNKEISHKSNVSLPSVKYCLRCLYQKLEVSNRYQAISKLRELDL